MKRFCWAHRRGNLQKVSYPRSRLSRRLSRPGHLAPGWFVALSWNWCRALAARDL